MWRKLLKTRIRTYFHQREEIGAAEMQDLKVMRPLEWGLDSLGLPPTPNPCLALTQYASAIIADSENFFSASEPSDVRIEGDHLSFESQIKTEDAENNRVHVRLFEKGRDRGRIVVLLPYWNAEDANTALFAKILKIAGIPVARMSLPYHDERQPEHHAYAEYLLSSNLGRTLRSIRQSVVDTRVLVHWLNNRGYERIGLVGLSLGATLASLVALHEERICCAAYSLLGIDIADAVWNGVATRHIRQSLEKQITLEDLSQIWAPVSPLNYLKKRHDRSLKQLVISAHYDRVTAPSDSVTFASSCKKAGIKTTHLRFPCGHYALGDPPFNVTTLAAIGVFLKRAC